MDIHKFGKVPSLTTHLHKNDIWQTWGAWLAGKVNDLLDSRAEAPFDQASSLQDSELSEEVLLEEVLCKSLFLHRQHGQPACWPATIYIYIYTSSTAQGGGGSFRIGNL